MKRFLPFVLVAFCGVALGAAAQKLQTYSYVPAELNAPCGKTLLEWNLIAGRIEAEPIPVTKDYELVRLLAEPKPEGIIVRAYVERAAKPTGTSQFSAHAVDLLARKRLGLGVMKQRVYVLTHLDNQLVGIRGNGYYHSLAPDATREEQLEALAKIMSHASPPAP